MRRIIVLTALLSSLSIAHAASVAAPAPVVEKPASSVVANTADSQRLHYKCRGDAQAKKLKGLEYNTFMGNCLSGK